jgi:hypothetical protein
MLCERYFQVRPSSLHSDHFSSLFEAFLVCSFFHSTLGHCQVIRVVHFKASLYKFYSFLTFFIDCEFRSDLKWRLFALLPSAAGLSRKKTAKLNFFPVLSSKTLKFTLFRPPNSSDNPIFTHIFYFMFVYFVCFEASVKNWIQTNHWQRNLTFIGFTPLWPWILPNIDPILPLLRPETSPFHPTYYLAFFYPFVIRLELKN